MKDIKDFILESTDEITVYPSKEGYIDEIDLSVNGKKFSKNNIKKLEKYFYIYDPVHLYYKSDWDDALRNLLDTCKEDNKVDEIKDNNSSIIKIYKYEHDSYIGVLENDNDTKAIIISVGFKL